MRCLFLGFCLISQTTIAQVGFNKHFDYSYYVNYFNNLTVQNDTIVAYGLAQDTAWPYLQGLLVARFDTLGGLIDNALFVDTSNSLYSIDKHWGKIISTSDGGFAMTAIFNFGADGALIKLNSKLEPEFIRKYRDTLNYGEFLVSPIEIPDGYLLYGYYKREGNYKHDALLRKVDKQGNEVWRNNFGVYNRDEEFYKAAIWNDSLIVLSGLDSYQLTEFETVRPYVSVFDKHGELQWDWTSISTSAYDGITLFWFYPQLDNTWLVYGSKFLGYHPINNRERYQSYWVKLDKDFQYLWSKPFGPNTGGANLFHKILQAPNGDIIGIGERGPYELIPEKYYRKGWIMRFSPDADSLWEWTGKAEIPNPGAHYFGGGALLSSGSIVAAGSGEDENGRSLCWLVKLSPDGCIDTLFCHATSSVKAFPNTDNKPQLFPNPADDYIQISGISRAADKLEVFDLMGRLKYSAYLEDRGKPLEILTQDYSNGIYFCRFLRKGEIVGTAKFLVQH